MATVTLNKLGKRFGALVALEALDLAIEDGEFLVLLGPSGCGKTTTMRMIAGLEEPTSGDILIDGTRVNGIHARDRDLAMVFQNYALYPHMTVGENIGYPLKVRGVDRAERLRKVEAAAAQVELSGLLLRRPAELSGGQRQRVALARAIVRTPRLFLMDEPLSNLDAKLRTVMRAELKHLQQSLGTTTIYVTHDQVEAMTLADRIVVLHEARIQQVGTPHEVYTRPANTFVAGFIGSPPMNLLAGEIRDGAFRHAAGTVPLAAAPRGEVVLGARPEDLALAAPADAHLTGTVFSSELLGDSTLVNVAIGDGLVAVKVGPDEGQRVGAAIGVRVAPAKTHLFAAEGGRRLETQP